MSAKSFFDTNIVVYAFSEGAKADAALSALEEGGVISVQILNEFVNVCRRKLKLDWAEIEARLVFVKSLSAEIVSLTPSMHEKAFALARDHGFAIYDALLVACAQSSGCDRLITEDMQHGRIIDGVRLENPFVQRLS